MRSIGAAYLLYRAWTLWSRSGKNIISGNTMLNQDFKEFVELLNTNPSS
jgi:threonine/homoserine/homoserine lactone efflux protein